MGFLIDLTWATVYFTVWVHEHGAWNFVAYQPTPIVNG
jgi:hypothetical protein